MKKPTKHLNQNARYRAFIDDRNRALEELLGKTRARADLAVAHLISDLSASIPGLVFRGRSPDAIDSAIRAFFDQAEVDIFLAYQKMRRLAYALSYTGEAEAIARADMPDAKYHLDNRKLQDVVGQDAAFGGALLGRIRLYLDRLRRRVIDQIQIGMLHGLNGDEVAQSVLAVMPKPYEVVRPQRELTPQSRLHEAADDREVLRGHGVNIASGFIDDETWNELVDEYRADEMLDDRTGEKIRFRGPSGRMVTRYDWELERDFTHDFVNLVRQGQLDVARENGYTDFVWLAVVDNATDECCLWRDGLTTKEIEGQLRVQRKDDECQTSVPPAHPNCRCDVAPVTDKIQNFRLPDIGGFEEWLTNP